MKNYKQKKPSVKESCLSTAYNIFTSILTERMYTFTETNEAFPLEQKGYKRGSYLYKDQLLIDKI